MAEDLRVVKIGGSLLRDRRSLHGMVEALIASDEPCPLLVVASAFHGVTDQLRLAAFLAADPRGPSPKALVEKLTGAHLCLAEGLGIEAKLGALLVELETLLAGVRRRGALGEQAMARVMSVGERASVLLLAAALVSRGCPARALGAEEAGLRARGPRLEGACDLAASLPLLQRLHQSLAREILVVTGFYGVDQQGIPLLFGRGGSDYSAAVLAAGLGARRLELWKDVAGLWSTDPRRLPQARRVEEVSFAEASCLAANGAEILHPRCLRPLQAQLSPSPSSRSQPVEIVLCAPGGVGEGTRIVPIGRRRPGEAAALASRPARVSVALPMVVGPAQTGRLLSRLIEAEVPFARLSRSGRPIELALRPRDRARARRALRGLGGAWPLPLAWSEQRARITLVGDRVAEGRGLELARRAFSQLGEALGDSELSQAPLAIHLPVEGELLQPTLAILHTSFFPDPGQDRVGMHNPPLTVVNVGGCPA